jgi:hypothetical protein
MNDQIDVRDLRPLADPGIRLDDGGQSTLEFCRYEGSPWLFKRFTDRHRAGVDAEALLRLVRWRTALAPADRDALDVVAAWPRHLVRSGGGVLVPLAPVDFLRRTPRGLAPRGLTELDGAGRDGRAPAETVAVLGALITVVRGLHRQEVVVNDLQADNVLCAPSGPRAGVHLVDCDSMVSYRHWGQVAPTAAPDLMNEVQPTREVPSVGTDLTKLMWLVARILLDAPTQVGLGSRDRAVLAAAVPASALLLAVLDRPADAAAWDQLGAAWSAVAAPPPPVAQQPAPVRRRSWLPADFSYRPDPGPPVLPARLRPGRFSFLRLPRTKVR